MQTGTPGSPATVKELLRQAEQQLHASASARLDAEVLLSSVTGLERTQFYSSPELDIDPHQIALFQAQVRERVEGKPVAYLTGVREFWSMPLQVNAHTLVPRPETECLVEAALQHVPAGLPLTLADLGTGCGAIALALARERPACVIIATDISKEALAVAGSNADHHVPGRISFVLSDWFSALPGNLAVIVSNPPYVRDDDEHLRQTDVRHEPRLALCGGRDGLDAIRQIINGAGQHLDHNGWLCIEHGCDQGAAVRDLFSDNEFTDIATFNDYAGLERVSCGRYEHT
jgi:release factor glutamine methyltransferase